MSADTLFECKITNQEDDSMSRNSRLGRSFLEDSKVKLKLGGKI
jgi:hypothetical protein